MKLQNGSLFDKRVKWGFLLYDLTFCVLTFKVGLATKTNAITQQNRYSLRIMLMKRIVWILILFALSNRTVAQEALTSDTFHTAFHQLLQRHVGADGRVQYAGFRREHAKLKAYLQQLRENVPNDSTPKTAAMAYWINTYNAFTIDLIVRNYPLKSILQLDNGKTWDVKRVLLGGKKYSLNQIENEILRKKWPDPRIHFALNCAAKSCPPLFNQAYTASQLDTQLAERTQLFINNPGFNQLNDTQLNLSKIFEWYSADFGDVPAFIRQYAEKNTSAKKIKYLEYNWDLNQ